MAVIRLFDKGTGNEVATITGFEIDTDKLADVTTFGSMGSAFITPQSDAVMQVTEFKTPVQPEVDRSTGYELQIVELNKVICALVRMIGGAVSINETELREASVGDLIVEQRIDPLGILLRLDPG